MKLHFEYGHGLMSADLPDRTDVFIPGETVKSPSIDESTLSIECRVKQISRLGSHDMVIADVLNVRADDKYIDPDTGRFCLDKARPIAYSHGFYYELGDLVGRFGFSVKK